jgi:hypothetical protein
MPAAGRCHCGSLPPPQRVPEVVYANLTPNGVAFSSTARPVWLTIPAGLATPRVVTLRGFDAREILGWSAVNVCGGRALPAKTGVSRLFYAALS